MLLLCSSISIRCTEPLQWFSYYRRAIGTEGPANNISYRAFLGMPGPFYLLNVAWRLEDNEAQTPIYSFQGRGGDLAQI